MIRYELHYREASDYLYFLDQAGKEWGAEAFVTAHYNNVVYLPDNQSGLIPLVVEAMPKYQGLNISEIDINVYDELKALYRVDDHADFDLTAHWYANWAEDEDGFGSNPLSKKTWLALYTFLTQGGGFSLDDMVQEVCRIAASWTQGLAVDVLADLNILYNSDRTEGELDAQALAALTTDESCQLAATYKEEGSVVFIYNLG